MPGCERSCPPCGAEIPAESAAGGGQGVGRQRGCSDHGQGWFGWTGCHFISPGRALIVSVLRLPLTTLPPPLRLYNVAVPWERGRRRAAVEEPRIKDALTWRRQRRRQNTSAWRQWVAEKLFNAAEAPTRRLCRELWDARLRSESSGQQRPSASAKRVPAGQGWGREGGNSPHPGQHRSQPAASTQSDLFPLPSLAPSLANAVCVAHCIARAQKMTGAKKDGDVCVPHSPSRSWGRRQVLWAAPGLEPPWLLPSSGRVS